MEADLGKNEIWGQAQSPIAELALGPQDTWSTKCLENDFLK